MWSDLKNCPCTRECPDRVPACHGKCPKYKEWTEKRDAAKKEANIRKEGRCLTEARRKANWKSRRRDNSGAFKKFSC